MRSPSKVPSFKVVASLVNQENHHNFHYVKLSEKAAKTFLAMLERRMGGREGRRREGRTGGREEGNGGREGRRTII